MKKIILTFAEEVGKYVREDGITGEQSGHVDLHTNPKFDQLFSFVLKTAHKYIETLTGTQDVWEPWLVKTWFSDFNVPPHDHSDAHLSFVYYVNVPPNSDPLLLIPPHDRLNDLTRGVFLSHPTEQVVSEYNQYNCESVVFEPKEGLLIMFPARLRHAVTPGERPTDFNDRRISISGDLLLTFKGKTARSMGLQPISNWRNAGAFK